MKMKIKINIKWLSGLIFAASIFISCKNIDYYTINGNLTGLENTDIYIVTKSDSVSRIDTIPAKNDKFRFTGVSDSLNAVVLYMQKGNVWATVWAKNGDNITLNGDVEYPELILAKGGEVNNLLSAFKGKNKALIIEKGDLNDKILINSNDSNILNTGITDAQYLSRIKAINQLLKVETEDFVKSNPASVASLVLIQDYILDVENVNDILPLLEQITDEAKENELYDRLQNWSIKKQQTEIGHQAPDFSLVNTQKDTLSLKSFENRYLLLTFAASWCPTCESDYAKWLAIRKAFPEKKVGMLTVSLDENISDWKELAKEKGITWMQAIDNAGWASNMVSLYNVSEIPCNYLIDKDGKIIGSKIPADSVKALLELKIKN
jgi:peroxiredoxin